MKEISLAEIVLLDCSKCDCVTKMELFGRTNDLYVFGCVDCEQLYFFRKYLFEGK